MLLICSDQDVTTMQAPKLGLTFRALRPSFPYLLNKVNDTWFSYFHYFFLMFHNCSSLISVLVSLQNYSICFSVVPCMLVATPVQTIISLSMEQGYQWIICGCPYSKIRVLKTCYPYGTKSCGLLCLFFPGNEAKSHIVVIKPKYKTK